MWCHEEEVAAREPGEAGGVQFGGLDGTSLVRRSAKVGFGFIFDGFAEIEGRLLSAPVRKRRSRGAPRALRLAGLP